MQGKLVAQDPNDEPARELLKRVEAEKERLAVEGKYRGETKVRKLDNHDTLFGTPPTWVWT